MTTHNALPGSLIGLQDLFATPHPSRRRGVDDTLSLSAAQEQFPPPPLCLTSLPSFLVLLLLLLSVWKDGCEGRVTGNSFLIPNLP
jgi:hypothetical protein